MKIRNRLIAVLTAAALCIPAAGCSADKSWALKGSDNASVPIGAYIYNLYSAYSQASSKVTDSSKDVLTQKIDNKDAKTWIREKALTGTKQILLVDKKMKAMGLTYSDASKKAADQMNSSVWGQYSSSFEKYGIAKSSFELSYGTTLQKEHLLFDAIYGAKGTKAVSDADLKSYYLKDYSDFTYMAMPLYTADANGNVSKVFTDAEKKTAKAVFDDYAAQIKAGTMTMQQAGDAYKAKQKSTDTLLHSESLDLTTDTNYPTEMKTALKAMKAGEVKAVEVPTAQMYVLIVKDDSTKSIETKLASSTDRENLLLSYKSAEFSSDLEKEADALKDVSVNDSALNSYDPKMFTPAS